MPLQTTFWQCHNRGTKKWEWNPGLRRDKWLLEPLAYSTILYVLVYLQQNNPMDGLLILCVYRCTSPQCHVQQYILFISNFVTSAHRFKSMFHVVSYKHHAQMSALPHTDTSTCLHRSQDLEQREFHWIPLAGSCLFDILHKETISKDHHRCHIRPHNVFSFTKQAQLF